MRQIPLNARIPKNAIAVRRTGNFLTVYEPGDTVPQLTRPASTETQRENEAIYEALNIHVDFNTWEIIDALIATNPARLNQIRARLNQIRTNISALGL